MLMEYESIRSFATQLDNQDPLSLLRSNFVIPESGLVYLDGNSLGRPSISSIERLQDFSKEWSHDLIRGFNTDWWQAPGRVGDKIAQLVGANPGQIVVCDTVSVNLFKLLAAALALDPHRTKIVTDTLNFPSDLYVLQGLVRMFGDRHTIVRIGSQDGDVSPDLEALEAAIDENTALVTLSHVTFKSGYLYDMAAITSHAHRHGALVLWDLSHSAGAVQVALDSSQADLAVGCTYKYLNGGPGSPAFLYVSKKLQNLVKSPIWGWWGHKQPFAFELDYLPAPGITQFLTGSQPIASLLAMESALGLVLETGMDALRKKSLRLSEYLIFLTDSILIPLGFTLGTPRSGERRGSHISLRHPEGYRINRALIEEMNVIPDFREPDNLRLGLTPLYTTFGEIWEAVDRISQIITGKYYKKYPTRRLTVT
jgi:kynureninase